MTILTDEYYPADEVGNESYLACEERNTSVQAAETVDQHAAAFEEEYVLNHEIEERQSEINRLLLKLEAVRSENDDLIKRIEAIRTEAMAIREESFRDKEQDASVSQSDLSDDRLSGNRWTRSGSAPIQEGPTVATFFQRVTLR